MVEVKVPITEKLMRDAKTDALLCPRPRTTRVFYISIGNLPPHKAEDFFIKVCTAYRESIDHFNFENIFIAIREGESRVEVLPNTAPVKIAEPSATPHRRRWNLGWLRG